LLLGSTKLLALAFTTIHHAALDQSELGDVGLRNMLNGISLVRQGRMGVFNNNLPRDPFRKRGGATI
jgi:hypothetical protein